MLCAVRGRACDLGDIRQGQAAVDQGLAEPLHEARTLRRELVAEGLSRPSAPAAESLVEARALLGRQRVEPVGTLDEGPHRHYPVALQSWP